MRCVIADDSYPQRQWLRGVLRLHGHEVVGMAANADDAFDLCLKETPDLALIDVNMPDLTNRKVKRFNSGKELAEKLKAENVVPHVMVQTSNSQNAVVQGFRALGIELMVKPYSDTQIIDRIGKLDCGNA